MQATHPSMIELLFLALTAIVTLCLWSACKRRRRFAMFGALSTAAVLGVFMTCVATYLFLRSRATSFPGPAAVRFQHSIGAYEDSGPSTLQLLDFASADSPGPPRPPRVVDPPPAASAAGSLPVEAPEKDSVEVKPAVTILPGATPPPEWVVRPPVNRVGEPYRLRVTVGPYETHDEVERNLAAALRRTVADYLRDEVSPDAGGMSVSTAFVNQLVVDRYDQALQFSTGLRDYPMVQSHVLLEVSDDAHGKLDRKWRREVVSGRLWHTGILGGLMMTVLGTIYSYLRLDTLTKGYYSLRLRTAAAAVILLAAAVSGFLASFSPLYFSRTGQF